jgi:outer membrane biosynthesis protein TonB
MSTSIVSARNRLSLSSGAGETYSPVAWIVAILLHIAVIAATFLTFAQTFEISDESTPMVPVDLVTISNKTNVMAMAKVQPKAPPVEAPTPPSPPPVPEQIPTPEPAPLQAAEPAPVPIVKPKPPPPNKQKPAAEDFDALLKKYTAPSAQPKAAKPGSRNTPGIGAMNAMNADLISDIQSQIQRCWSAPVGAPHPEQLIVNFELFLNHDGSVAQPPQLAADSAAAEQGNPFMRAAVESARRAIYTCAPYRLPPDRFGQWRDITFTFNPVIMAGAQ